MPWVELLAVFIVCHLIGDFLLQTNFQALNKHGGLGRDPVARRALFSHVTIYTAAFIPALIWIGSERGAGWVAIVAALVFFPHLIQDDGRLVVAYSRRVKKLEPDAGALMVAVDQSFHIVTLFGIALLAAS